MKEHCDLDDHLGYNAFFIIAFTFNFSSKNFNNMSQLLSEKMRMAAGALGLVVCFLVFGTVDAKAQGQARAATGNPYTLVAQKLGVVACAPGTATNLQGGLTTLENETAALKPTLVDGTATLLNRVKYEYYQMILTDVNAYSVAVEFASLTNLTQAAKLSGDESITNQQLAALYNGVRTAFGMCQ